MANVVSSLHFTFDAELEFKDAGLIAASAAAQVDATNKIVDFGQSIFHGILVIDITAIEIASNDERFDILVQGSSSATFSTDVENLACMTFGATEVTLGSADDSVTGRYLLPFINMQKDTVTRYGRVYTNVVGTIASGINYKAWVGKTMMI